MYCSKCGFNVPEKALFCPSCGNTMPVKKTVTDNDRMNVSASPVSQGQPVQKKNNLPVIIGCVVGGIVLIILLIVLVYLIADGASDLDDVNWGSEQTTADAEPEEVQFRWIKEPFFEADDMSGIFDYNADYKNEGIFLYYSDGKCGLVDYEGNKICDALYTEPDYCKEFEGITFNSHTLIFEPEAGRIVEHGGHGGGYSKMVYDINTRAFLFICSGEGPAEEIDYDTTGCYIVYECSKEYYQYYGQPPYYNYTETGRIGLYNNGELVIPFDYILTTGISDDIIGMYDGEAWTYFDLNGNVVLENAPENGDVLKWSKVISASDYTYQDMYTELVYEFSCGCVPMKQGDLWGYMDKNGEMVIDAQFEKALPAFNYKAWVCVDGVWGLIEIP